MDQVALKGVNLAAFRYAGLLDDQRGPFEKYQIQRLANLSYEILVWLKSDLRFQHLETSGIYGNCDAMGTDRRLHVAGWKAISEGLERWAFHSLLTSKSPEYGLDVDSTTTGFAAYPGWPESSVRRFAWLEACERWAVSNWWRGRLKAVIVESSAPHSDYGVVRIVMPPSMPEVVVLFSQRKNPNGMELFAYGFAAGINLKKAIGRSVIELERNAAAIMSNQEFLPQSITDLRLQYFASPQGFADFQSRVDNGESIPRVPPPRMIVDAKVDGPWNRYATIWRCLYENTDYRWQDKRHFMF